MCGIVGFYAKKDINREAIADAMLAKINYRGPDDSNIYHNQQTTLGHNRLAIIDLEHAQQPFESHDKNFVMIFNGEIYNYIELRQQLIRLGYQFYTQSDTEVLLNCYLEYGEDCLNYLNGMFAFVIYNKQKDSLFIARDHFGIKPLYYTLIDDGIVFASEIKAILQYPDVKAKVNYRALNQYFHFQFSLGDQTLFAEIMQLEPANYLVVKKGKIQRKVNYWKVDYKKDHSKKIEEYLGELTIALEKTLSMQTRADVPVGTYLSGGIDSSTVTMLAHKNYQGELKTFTGGFKFDKAYDETRYAKIVAEQSSCENYTIFPTANDFIDTFPSLIYHMDQPAGGPGLFPQYMVSKLAKQHVKVVLGGQGGDEIFGGYARYYIAYLEKKFKQKLLGDPQESKGVALDDLISNLSQVTNYMPLMKKQFSSGLFDDDASRYFSLLSRVKDKDMLYSKDYLDSHFDNEKLFDDYQNIFNRTDEDTSFFDKMLNFDLQTHMHALLQVEDRVSMAVSLESRVPLLDKNIVELAAQLPIEYKFAKGRLKAFFIEGVQTILPSEIVNRTDKMGFPVPLNEWMKGDLKPFVLDLFSSSSFKDRGIFNAKGVLAEAESAQSFSREIWGIMCLETWFREFID